ncbi:hypothetical protein HT031_005412 [Scenedesmus sp. PABB004]|nr:hypothetical protein HT031_005412 [Scenedesmus sp. PABB004]
MSGDTTLPSWLVEEGWAQRGHAHVDAAVDTITGLYLLSGARGTFMHLRRAESGQASLVHVPSGGMLLMWEHGLEHAAFVQPGEVRLMVRVQMGFGPSLNYCRGCSFPSCRDMPRRARAQPPLLVPAATVELDRVAPTGGGHGASFAGAVPATSTGALMLAPLPEAPASAVPAAVAPWPLGRGWAGSAAAAELRRSGAGAGGFGGAWGMGDTAASVLRAATVQEWNEDYILE